MNKLILSFCAVAMLFAFSGEANAQCCAPAPTCCSPAPTNSCGGCSHRFGSRLRGLFANRAGCGCRPQRAPSCCQSVCEPIRNDCYDCCDENFPGTLANMTCRANCDLNPLSLCNLGIDPRPNFPRSENCSRRCRCCR